MKILFLTDKCLIFHNFRNFYIFIACISSFSRFLKYEK